MRFQGIMYPIASNQRDALARQIGLARLRNVRVFLARKFGVGISFVNLARRQRSTRAI